MRSYLLELAKNRSPYKINRSNFLFVNKMILLIQDMVRKEVNGYLFEIGTGRARFDTIMNAIMEQVGVRKMN